MSLSEWRENTYVRNIATAAEEEHGVVESIPSYTINTEGI